MGARPIRAPAPRPAEIPACLTGARSTRFLVELAHDLRSPLTAILTLAESMLSGVSGPLTAAQRKQLALVHASALRLCGTASDALELARGEEGEAYPVREFSLGELVEEVCATVLPMAEEKEVVVEIDGESEGTRFGRDRALRRTLLNLATNALKVTERGSVRISFRAVDETHVAFAVTDTGPGMDLKTLRDLWRPFRPTATGLHSTFSSSGLGLSICRKLVKEMGGKLRVSTELGRGSEFSFVIPLRRAPK